MNKTVNINLAGIVFHIDEDAFERLNNYLDTLKNHFENDEGRDEILKDIEGRIAELFSERMIKKEVVSLADVYEITTIMGDPSQYDDEIEQEKSQDFQYKEDDLRQGKRRKVFRDEEGRVIGGVCSGLAHYFDIGVFWFRIIFIILLFAIGGGPLMYLILWIAIPSAKTTAEKLEMKGEKVNINNIEKNIKDELNIIENRILDFENKYTKELFGANSLFRKIVDFFIRVITGVFKFAGSCFGLFCVLFGGILLFLISSFAFSEAEFLFQSYPMIELILNDSLYIVDTLGTWLSLFIGIPIIAIILFGLRLLNNTKIHMNYKVGIFVLWIISLFFLIDSAKDISVEFQEEAKNIIIENIVTERDTLYLSMNDVDRVFDDVFDAKGFKVTPFEDNLIGIGMQLDIVKSKNDNLNIIKEVTARGKNKVHAKEMTEGVDFEFTLEDENLILDDFFTISTQKWRMQELGLTLELPVGMVVFLDHSLEDLIYDIKNVNNMWDYDMLGHYWKMEKEGLRCISCEGQKR
jgi:phage shock protein PspC (stress-responsive transcriptional regulator)